VLHPEPCVVPMGELMHLPVESVKSNGFTRSELESLFTVPAGGFTPPLPEGGKTGLEGLLTVPDGGTIPDAPLEGEVPTLGIALLPGG
jgi:hypothetical protein